jgi:hypothetical protein
MYKPGDYLVICDKCGMRRYASECRLDWQNLLLCEPCWEPRHPQDFVEGVEDDQSVPISRPAVAASMGETTVKTTAAANATTIDLTSTTGIADKDAIGIVLDAGTVHWTYSDDDPSGDTVTLGSYLPGTATAGNVVYLPSINNETYISPTDLEGSEL